MQKYIAMQFGLATVEPPYLAHPLNLEVYLAADVDARITQLEAALRAILATKQSSDEWTIDGDTIDEIRDIASEALGGEQK